MPNVVTRDKWYQLAKKLLEQTRSGKILWDVDIYSGQVIAPIGSHNICLSSDEGTDDFFVRVEDRFEAVVDRFGTKDYEAHEFEERQKIKELYVEARRSATNADAAIDEILDALGD